MPQTYIGSTLRTGSGSLTDTVDGGFVVVSQTAVLTSVSAGTAVAGTLRLPADSQIIEIIADKIVDWVVGAGTATELNVSVGSAAGGAQYMAVTDLAATARATGPSTVATVAACDDIDNNTVVHLTVDPNGTVLTTQAQIRFTVVYAQK